MARRKPSAADLDRRQKELDDLHEQIQNGVEQASGQWKNFLTFASKFTSYSMRNQILIWLQNPNASLVAGYKHWQTLGRQVTKGQRGLRVLAPVIARMPHDKDGNPIPKDQVKQYPKADVVWRRKMVNVKPTSVFDVSQTEGDPIPEPPTPALLTGQAPPGLWQALEGIATEHQFTVTRVDPDTLHGANGVTYFDGSRRILIRNDVDDAQAVKTLAHEVTHMLLHGPDSKLRDEATAHRGTAEIEAESVAFMIASRHGMDTSEYTFPYVTGWANGDPERVVDAGGNIMKAAQHILDRTQHADHNRHLETTQAQQQRAEQVRERAEAQQQAQQQRAAAAREQAEAQQQLSKVEHTRINAEADAYYQQRMQADAGAGPRSYLDARGLSALTVAGAAVAAGHAPAGWTNLTDHLKERGYSDEQIQAAGLGVETRFGTTVDRFRDRITLPIRDHDGDIVGFIGRAPEQREANVPKYLNSAENPHFHKRDTVYGLDQVNARDQGDVSRIVVTEGPFDAAAVNTAARTEGRADIVAVATAGTALTASHSDAIRAAAEAHDARIVVDFDPDAAGQAATHKALTMLPAERTHVAPALGALDPAEIHQQMGPGPLVATVDVARPAHHWQLDQILNSADSTTVEGGVRAARQAAPIIANAPTREQDQMWQHTADTLNIGPETIDTLRSETAGTFSLTDTRQAPQTGDGEEVSPTRWSANDHLNPYHEPQTTHQQPEHQIQQS